MNGTKLYNSTVTKLLFANKNYHYPKGKSSKAIIWLPGAGWKYNDDING